MSGGDTGSPATRGSTTDTTIAIVTGGIPHYRWAFFSELASRGVSVNIVAAGRLAEGMLASQAPDSRVRVTQLRSAGKWWRSDVVRTLRAIKPDAVVVEHGASLDYSWTTLLSKRVRAPRILWTHGIARQELYGGDRGLASRGRWAQLRLADGIVCYDHRMAARMASRFPSKAVGAAPNSTDGTAIAAERDRCASLGRAVVRRELGVTAEYCLVGLGRLVPEKNFGRLLRVGARLRKKGVDVAVVIVGAGPEEASVRSAAQALGMRHGRDVIFAGGIADPAMLSRWLYASDACVSPGPLGLSVADCLFAGTPVLSVEASRAVQHGPEWQYLVPGETGFFASDSTDDALTTLCDEFLARTAPQRDAIRAACAKSAMTQLGVAKMADGMLRVINALRLRETAERGSVAGR